MTLPTLTESAIRERGSSQSWQRAQAYLNDGSVHNLTWRGDERGILTAEVYGNTDYEYQIQITIVNNAIVDADCSCPYDFGGDCKHILATALNLLYDPDEIVEGPSVESIIDGLDREQLSWILRTLAERQPATTDLIELLASQAKQQTVTNSSEAGSSEAGSSETASPPTPVVIPAINEKLLRRQIVADLPRTIEHGYDSWGEEAWYDSDLSSALGPAVEQIQLLLDAGEPQQALSILAVATDAWDEGADKIDEYFYEHFADSDADFLLELNQQWTEAVLRAELSAEERVEWADRLDEWVESMFCGGGLEMAARAARDGWTYPPLAAAMAGNITELGAWAEDDEIEHWVGELAKIRIDILEARGELEAARNLAEAEGEYIRFLQLMIKLEQIDEAIAKAKENLTGPDDIHKIAQTLAETGELSKALKLGQHGLDLKLPKKDPDSLYYVPSAHRFEGDKAKLSAWLRDVAVDANEPKLALSYAQHALQSETDLPNYIRLQEVAGDQWTTLQPETLKSIMMDRPSDEMVDILLHEQMYEEVTQAVDQITHFYNIDKVLAAVQTEFPQWAFRQCAKRGEDIMNQGKAKYYDAATDWLRRGRDILRSAGHDQLWSSYIEVVMSEHHRKRKLIPMLREIA